MKGLDVRGVQGTGHVCSTTVIVTVETGPEVLSRTRSSRKDRGLVSRVDLRSRTAFVNIHHYLKEMKQRVGRDDRPRKGRYPEVLVHERAYGKGPLRW